jgi:Toprim-like
MNAINAREIPIKKILQNLGCEPIKSNENESWYLSPFRVEKTASFKLNLKLNRWYDHGEQMGGNSIDFVVAKFGFSIPEALNYLEQFNSFFSFHQQVFEPVQELKPQILKVKPIEHLALVQYLESRGIKNYQNTHLKEVHYSVNKKQYFSLGFENRSGGFELRSKYAKLCIAKKDVSLISNQSQILRIFEGFFDYLSFQEIRDTKKLEQSDYLILNSVALMHKNLDLLSGFKSIEMYLDLDEAGDKHTNLILEKFENAIDCRALFSPFKDLNEWLKVCNLEVR